MHDNSKYQKAYGPTRSSCIADGKQDGTTTLENTWAVSQEIKCICIRCPCHYTPKECT